MENIYKLFGIYRITNKTNGMSYIGKTGMNFGDRWDCHRAQLNGGYHDNPHLQNAWNKYGADNFEFAMVEVVDDASELNDLEMKYISEYRSRNLAYNMHDGGDGGYNLGKHLSEETKRKIGEKNRNNMIGKKASMETREKMSASQRDRYARWTDNECKAWGEKMSKAASGYCWSEDSKNRFSEIQRKHPNRAKFTIDDIRDIRTKRADGMTLQELAKEYNSSPSYISHIVNRRRWAYVE